MLTLTVGFVLGVGLTVGTGLWVKHLADCDSRFLQLLFPRWMARKIIVNALIEREIRQVFGRNGRAVEGGGLENRCS